MVVFAETLFGSRARGDHSENSDVDLLHVTNDDRAAHSQTAGVSVSSYPLTDLKQRAATGDLFLYHVLFEGLPLYDPEGHFGALKEAFKLRSDYSVDIRKAVDLGWFIVHHHRSIPDRQMIGRRAAWVTRTILIAASAEKGRPVFSRDALAAEAPGTDVLGLISAKDSISFAEGTLGKLAELLRRYGDRSSFVSVPSQQWFVERFKRSQNVVALRLLSPKRATDDDRYA